MELVIPYMLMFLHILDEHPVSVILERDPVLYRTEKECLAAGEAMLERYSRIEDVSAEDFRYWCLEAPDLGEYREALRPAPPMTDDTGSR